MSNIAKAFENGKAFIPFITCGDPDLETTAEIVKAMSENGADLIELGIPFPTRQLRGPLFRKRISALLPAELRQTKYLNLCESSAMR